MLWIRSTNSATFLHRHPIATYFCLAFLVSWGGFVLLVGPKLLAGHAMRASDALLLFPIMELGVCLVGIILTALVAGRRGLRNLFSRLRRWRVGWLWYLAAVLIPPVLILLALLSLRSLLSPVFTPHLFLLGLLFGLFAGLFEEIGWTGYAWPKLRANYAPFIASLVLGLLWGLWHLPVIDFLGAASPHGSYWLPYVLTFIAVVTAMRVLLCWVYDHTTSLLLAQLMHASSTGFLVVLSPVAVSPAQETLWYALYAILLWLGVAIIAATASRCSVSEPHVARGH